MGQYIERTEDGCRFETYFNDRLSNAKIEYISSATEDEYRKKMKQKSRKSKTKYTCLECGQNAWAKPGASLICGDCVSQMVENEPA